MTSLTEKTNAEVCNKESFQKLQNELLEFEKSLNTRTKNLQKHLLNDLRENIPQENNLPPSDSISDVVSRLHKALKTFTKTEEEIITENKNLQKQIEFQEAALEEIQMERDVLLERIHTYLETNSSLKIRLEEQRCQTAALERQLEGDLESKARVLEKDNERLNGLILEKDKELKKMNYMLEKIVNKKVKKEEIIENLRKKLSVVLMEKMQVEEESKKLHKTDSNKIFRRCLSLESIKLFNEPLSKVKAVNSNLDFDNFIESTPCLSSSTPNKLNQVLPILQKKQDKNVETSKKGPNPEIHVQLNALKSGLVNVTQKLKVLKSQLFISNTPSDAEIKDFQKPRNLKRKAEPLDAEDVEEEPKDRKNLKDILEDAKNLNAKLQNLREEKQKIIETNRQSFEKSEKFSQTCEELEEDFPQSPNVTHVQKIINKLRTTVADCEEKLDKEEINKDEASEVLLSAFSSCVFSNLRYFHESEKRGVNSLKDEIDMELLMDGKSKESKGMEGKGEKEERREDGGGDNHLKKKMESDVRGCEELKFQISKIKLEIENFKKLEA